MGSTYEFEETRAAVFLMPLWPAHSSKMPKVAADPPIHNAPKLHGFPISHELVIKGGLQCTTYVTCMWLTAYRLDSNTLDTLFALVDS